MATTSRDSLRGIPLALLVVTLLFLGAAALGWLPSDSRSCRGIAVLFGVFTLSGIMIRPAWFWNSRKARRARAAFGDRLYAALLSALALGLVYMGLVGSALDQCSIG
jgi:predicted small integral membrane protein